MIPDVPRATADSRADVTFPPNCVRCSSGSTVCRPVRLGLSYGAPLLWRAADVPCPVRELIARRNQAVNQAAEILRAVCGATHVHAIRRNERKGFKDQSIPSHTPANQARQLLPRVIRELAKAWNKVLEAESFKEPEAFDRRSISRARCPLATYALSQRCQAPTEIHQMRQKEPSEIPMKQFGSLFIVHRLAPSLDRQKRERDGSSSHSPQRGNRVAVSRQNRAGLGNGNFGHGSLLSIRAGLRAPVVCCASTSTRGELGHGPR